MSISTLFRREVADAKKNAWLGEVQIARPLPITIVAAVSLALVSSTVAYVCLGTYTRRVHASGALMPSAGLITVASPAAGLVSSAAVAEGNQVHTGDLLFVINLESMSSDGPTQQRVIEELRQQKSSIEKARDLRVASANIEKQSLAEQLDKLKIQRKHLSEQIAVQTETSAPIKERAQVLRQGVKSGIVRDSEFQSQNYILNQTVTQLGHLQETYLQLDARFSEMSANLALFDTKLAQDINVLDRGILQLEQQITETQARRAIEVHAPADGTLTSIRAHAGEQVAAGVPLLTLLPASGKLTAHFYVDSSAIGFIDMGELVIMRYAAFPFQRFGLYRGVVAEVTRAPVHTGDDSPVHTGDDSIAWGAEPKAKAGNGLYRIVVDPELAYVEAYGERRPLEAGMKVEADIAIETRPIYSYIFDPLKHLQRSVGMVAGGGSL
jgi:membrane fusion protein